MAGQKLREGYVGENPERREDTSRVIVQSHGGLLGHEKSLSIAFQGSTCPALSPFVPILHPLSRVVSCMVYSKCYEMNDSRSLFG